MFLIKCLSCYYRKLNTLLCTITITTTITITITTTITISFH